MLPGRSRVRVNRHSGVVNRAGVVTEPVDDRFAEVGSCLRVAIALVSVDEDRFQLIGEASQSSIGVGVYPAEFAQPGTAVERSPIEVLGTVRIDGLPVFPHGWECLRQPRDAPGGTRTLPICF